MLLDKTIHLYILICFSMYCPQQQNDIDCGYFVLKFIKEIIQMNEIEIPITVWIYNLLWIYTLFYYLSDISYNLLLLTKSCIFFIELCSILMNTSVHITRNFNWKNSKRSCVNILLSKESYKV